MECDPDFQDVVRLKNVLVSPLPPQTPAMVVMASSEDDVVKAIKFTKTWDLLFSVKSTGHCMTGNCMVADSLHLDMTGFTDIKIDLAAGVLRAGPGANFVELYDQCDKAGVLVVGGLCDTVGLVGFTLGGGHGPLARRFGAGADNLVEVTMVTANATVMKVSIDGNTLLENSNSGAVIPPPDESSDLFWALRGGGGGTLGVVTEIVVRVHQAPPSVVGFSCAYPVRSSQGEVGLPVLDHYLNDVLDDLPPEWFVALAVNSVPNPTWDIARFYAADPTLQGVLLFQGVYSGEWGAAATESIAPLLQFHPEWQLQCELSNMTSFRAWHDTFLYRETPAWAREYMTSSFMQPDADRSALARQMTSAPLAPDSNATATGPVIRSYFFLPLGHAVREGGGAVGDSFRSSLALVEAFAVWYSPAADAVNSAWSHQCDLNGRALKGMEGSYSNEADPKLANWENEFWGQEKFSRLQRIKRAWDGEGLFHCEQCVY